MTASAAVATERSNTRKVIASSLVGTVLEFYEFFVYGTMAALVLGDLFFPSGDPVASTLAAFATFAVGFIARPIGSILFGHLGDRLGRKATLITSLSLMGASTVAIGLLPTFGQVGVLAPILLVVARLVQGLALGGEWGGAALMLVENASSRRKAVMGSVVMIGVPGGLVLASLVSTLSIAVSGDQFATWGWRVPFVISAALLAIALFIRLAVSETPEFIAAKAALDKLPKAPIGTVFRRHWLDLVLAFGVCAPGNALFFIIATFTINYATATLGMPQTEILVAQGVAAVIYCGTIPLVGLLADRIGTGQTELIGAIAAGIFIPVYFLLLDTAEIVPAFVAMVIGMAGVHALLQAPQAALFASRFAVPVRYTGIALSQSIPTTLVGGTVAYLATWFVSITGDASLVIGYVIALSAIAVVCAIGYRFARSRTAPDLEHP